MKKILLLVLCAVLIPLASYAYTVGESPTMLPPSFSAYAPEAGASDQGTTSTVHVTLKNLVDEIGTGEQATIIFAHTGAGDTTTYTLTTNETVPSNIGIWMEHGAILDGAGTLTINGPFEAGLYQVFGSSITVIFGAGAVKEVYPQWRGAKGDDSTNDTAALQWAVDAYPEVYIPKGTYRYTALYVPANRTITGSGAKDTVLAFTPATGNGINLSGNGAGAGGGSGGVVNITNLKVYAINDSTGAGIVSEIADYIGDVFIDQFEVEGFLSGVYIPYGVQVEIGKARLIGQGKAVANGIGCRLGDNDLGGGTTVNTGRFLGVYASDYETNFYSDGTIHIMEGITSETCINAIKVKSRLSVAGSWIQADTKLVEIQVGGWTYTGNGNLYYNGANVEQDDLLSGSMITLNGGYFSDHRGNTLSTARVRFPATQEASAGVNTLDDYQEGTYEPTITCSTSGSYVMSTNKTLAYTKIGRVVHVQGRIDITSESLPVGNINISLPFTSANLTQYAGCSYGSAFLWNHGGNIPNAVTAVVGEGVDYFQLHNVADDGTIQTIDKDDVDTAWSLGVNFSYFAT